MSQGSAFLATTGVYSGLTAANAMNAALDALLTGNSGSSAPTNALGGVPKLGQHWLDTTSATLPILKIYTGSAWLVVATIDVSNGLWLPVVGGGLGTIASATTTNIGAQPQSSLSVTGTTTITGLGSSAAIGQRKVLIFAGILTFTHNATSLIIPGGLSKTTAAGDVAEVVYLGSGNWRVLSYVPIVGTNVTSIAGNTGAFTLSHGITNSTNDIQLAALASLAATLSSPTATTNATGLMMGLGSQATLTPLVGTKILVTIDGTIQIGTNAQSASIQGLRFGTGTAPSNAAALSGSVIGSATRGVVKGQATVPTVAPFSVSGIATGLTPGVAVWFDLGLSATSAASAAIANLTATMVEML